MPSTAKKQPATEAAIVQLRAWMEEARDELQTLAMQPGFIRDYPITAAQYRDLAERCPLPEKEHDDEPL